MELNDNVNVVVCAPHTELYSDRRTEQVLGLGIGRGRKTEIRIERSSGWKAVERMTVAWF